MRSTAVCPAVPDFLPDLLPGETELARIAILRGFAAGELALRTRRDPARGGWRHRLVDEHGTAWTIRPARTLRPLTPEAILGVIATATAPAGPIRTRGLLEAVWAALRLDEVAGSVRITSARHPAVAQVLAEREAVYLADWGARPPARPRLHRSARTRAIDCGR